MAKTKEMSQIIMFRNIGKNLFNSTWEMILKQSNFNKGANNWPTNI